MPSLNVETRNASGERINASFWMDQTGTAYIESSCFIGLNLLAEEDKNLE